MFIPGCVILQQSFLPLVLLLYPYLLVSSSALYVILHFVHCIQTFGFYLFTSLITQTQSNHVAVHV